VIDSSLKKWQAGAQLIYNPRSVQQVQSVINTFKPDVMHCHNTFPIASPGIYGAAKALGVPVVQTLHNFRLLCANALLFRDGHPCEACVNKSLPLEGIIHGCYRQSKLQSGALTGMTAFHRLTQTWQTQVDQFIVLTDFARQKFSTGASRIPLSHMTVKPNFVFDAGEDEGTARENFILFIGRLSVEKDIPSLLTAFSQTDIPLKIVGVGPFEDLVRQAAATSPNIQYLGYQDKTSVLALLKKARAFILPSTCYEGCPMTILEAFSTGTPVLVSQTGGLPELVTHNEDGLLFEPGNPNSLLAQVQSIAVDDQLHARLSHNARASYVRRFTPEQHFAQTMAVYQQVCEATRLIKNPHR